MKNIAQRYSYVVNEIIKAEQTYGRRPGSIKLLAVSKTRSADEIVQIVKLGQRDFGENYVQEALKKITLLQDEGLTWHFIGPVQSNKTRIIARYFDWVHSLDRPKIAQRLNDMRPESMPALNICIEVNISGEATKSGIKPDLLLALADTVSQLPRLRLRGLMALPALAGDFEQQRHDFHRLGDLLKQLKIAGFPVDTLSMGTTNDMPAAIAEGATIVRIGTAIFGPRE